MRIDKFLVECGLGSRKEVKTLISNRLISVNGETELQAKDNIDIEKDIVEYEGRKLEYKEFRYYIMNKKSGYITAVFDLKEPTVMDLLPKWVIRKDLVPVGRLDKDTEGLLLFTNNGKLNHKLLSPKNHVDKTYYVELKNGISTDEIFKLEQGVDIGGYITQPAKIIKVDEKKINLTISEGKFHQVKKMLEAIGNEVLFLKRISFGKIQLDNLLLGEVKEIKLEDII